MGGANKFEIVVYSKEEDASTIVVERQNIASNGSPCVIYLHRLAMPRTVAFIVPEISLVAVPDTGRRWATFHHQPQRNRKVTLSYCLRNGVTQGDPFRVAQAA